MYLVYTSIRLIILEIFCAIISYFCVFMYHEYHVQFGWLVDAPFCPTVDKIKRCELFLAKFFRSLFIFLTPMASRGILQYTRQKKIFLLFLFRLLLFISYVIFDFFKILKKALETFFSERNSMYFNWVAFSRREVLF